MCHQGKLLIRRVLQRKINYSRKITIHPTEKLKMGWFFDFSIPYRME